MEFTEGPMNQKKVMAILYGTISLILRGINTNGLGKTLEDLRKHASWASNRKLESKVDKRAYREMLIGLSFIDDNKTGNDTVDSYVEEFERLDREEE